MASIGIMSAGIAHEINNPLNFISVSVDNIQTQIKETEKEGYQLDEEKLNVINRLISHAKTGVGRILSITRSLKAYSHKGEVEKQFTNVKDLIDNVLTIINAKIPHYVTINLKYATIPEIKCKQDQISQVLLNIIDNAIQAIEEKSLKENEQIIIETGMRNHNGQDYVAISISNSGPLLKDDDMRHLFDPFYTTKSPNKGTGLGLYISYEIINDHNGFIHVENIKKCVKFDVLLPVN